MADSSLPNPSQKEATSQPPHPLLTAPATFVTFFPNMKWQPRILTHLRRVQNMKGKDKQQQRRQKSVSHVIRCCEEQPSKDKRWKLKISPKNFFIHQDWKTMMRQQSLRKQNKKHREMEDIETSRIDLGFPMSSPTDRNSQKKEIIKWRRLSEKNMSSDGPRSSDLQIS